MSLYLTPLRETPVFQKDRKIAIEALSGGATFVSYGRDSSGYLWAWGYNTYGQMGNNTFAGNGGQSWPGAINGPAFTKISTCGNPQDGTRTSVALDISGYAWAWGFNQTGQLGINSVAHTSWPVSVVGGNRYSDIKVVSKGTLVLALDISGYAWAWGYNSSGQLGDGTTSNRSSPVSVVGGRVFTAIDAESNSILALDASSYAWAWGYNAGWQLGNNTVNSASSPVSVVGGHQFTKTFASTATMFAIDSSGNTWAWGTNNSGQLGDNTLSSKSSPVSLAGHTFTSVTPVYSGGYTVAIDTAGFGWAWGNNIQGMLGDGTTTNSSSPISIIGGHQFTKLKRAGVETVLGLDTSGFAWAWGTNTYGALGDGTETPASSPVSVVGGHVFSDIVANTDGPVVAVLDASSYAWAWGYNLTGQLGDGTVITKSSPVSVVGGHQFITLSGNGSGSGATMGIDTSNHAWGWGDNVQWYLGILVPYSSPVSVVGGHQFTAMSSNGLTTVGLDASGYAWAWGDGSNGILGNGNNVLSASPASVVGGHQFSKIYCTAQKCLALDLSGYAWGWGTNTGGYMLADGTTSPKSSPVSVVGAHQFVRLVATETSNTIGIDISGFAWGWGQNTYGVLGAGSAPISYSSPNSVLGGIKFANILMRASGKGSFSVGLDTSGFAWSWGINGAGQLGTNNTANRSSPMSVLGGHQFKNLSVMADTVIAVDYSNYAWAWGTGTTGQLGNGAATNRSSPVSVIGDRQFAVPPANVAELASKNVGAAFVILDTSGFAWSWGRNLEGQLGDGTVTNRSSPVSVLGGNQFKSLMLQDRIVGAVDKNNAVWTWGVNDMGQLGDGTLVGRSSPVSVVRVML